MVVRFARQPPTLFHLQWGGKTRPPHSSSTKDGANVHTHGALRGANRSLVQHEARQSKAQAAAGQNWPLSGSSIAHRRVGGQQAHKPGRKAWPRPLTPASAPCSCPWWEDPSPSEPWSIGPRRPVCPASLPTAARGERRLWPSLPFGGTCPEWVTAPPPEEVQSRAEQSASPHPPLLPVC